ncbi:MAG: PEP/pyruvate-binding domain-containing protein [Bacteroides sp.]|nr:PEP/pyruvate-binding domain-containing protein [Bacteroides sp.]
MHKLGFPVPESYVIPMKLKETFSLNPEKVRAQIRKEIIPLAEKNTSWAIRSSGELEDLKNHSFAGQFVTILDVRGTDEMMDSIEKVWESGERVRDGLYNTDSVMANKPAGMSVIIQEMVQSQWSGVAFSINPVTGRHEFVIEAVKGSGVQLVQDGVKPYRWTWCQGNWNYEGDAEEDIKGVLELLVNGIKVLQKAWDGAVDIEWAYDGQQLFYLQCREVTVSEFPCIYSNHISREVLPGMIKPLVWSVNIPLVNSAWIRLLEGLLGKLNIKPEELSKSFYYRAYFNMGTLGALFKRMGLPNDSLESLMGRKNPSGKSSFKPGLKTMSYVPSMLGFVLKNLNIQRKFRKEFEGIRTSTDQLTEKLKKMKVSEYHSHFEELHRVASRAAYFNILIPLSFQISNRILQQKLKKRRIPFESLDFHKDFPELSAYDPGDSLSHLQQSWAKLPAELQERIKDFASLSASKDDPLLKDIHERFIKLIGQFGHFSESGNDFSSTPWREDPDFLFRQICQLSEGAPASREASANLNLRSKGIPRRAYRRAGRFRLYREMISSEYTRCYGLFRELFLITGKSFHENALLDDPRDVFYLTLDQHNRLLEGPPEDEAKSTGQMLEKVKQEMEEFREVVLPSVIYGDTPPPMLRKNEEVLEGIPTSPGIYEGELVVVRGYADFEKKVEGAILVIPFSDVGWTPLLVRAGAIVSESGGILSHASIIAREMSIPAISSVDHACSLQDGANATIDGTNGKLFINK